MKSFFRTFQGWAVLALLLSCLGLAACSKGPFSPEARQQSAERDRYLKALRAALVTDDTFEWKSLSSALIVRALPYSPAVAEEAELRFRDAPPFFQEVAGWSRSNRSGRPLVILMGIYASDLKEKDIVKLGRFRPRLVSPDGRLMPPLEIKRFGRDSVFIRDYFPVFNPWEEVYLIKFASSGRAYGPLEFRLEWPGGAQSLMLNYR